MDKEGGTLQHEDKTQEEVNLNVHLLQWLGLLFLFTPIPVTLRVTLFPLSASWVIHQPLSTLLCMSLHLGPVSCLTLHDPWRPFFLENTVVEFLSALLNLHTGLFLLLCMVFLNLLTHNFLISPLSSFLIASSLTRWNTGTEWWIWDSSEAWLKNEVVEESLPTRCSRICMTTPWSGGF